MYHFFRSTDLNDTSQLLLDSLLQEIKINPRKWDPRIQVDTCFLFMYLCIYVDDAVDEENCVEQ